MNYISLFSSYMFMPAITIIQFPDGDRSPNPFTLDHIFLNKRTNFQSGIIYCDISDHCSTFLMYKLKTTRTNEFHKFKFRSYSERNFDKLFSEIEQINWDTVICPTDVGVSFRGFIDLINGLYTECFPLKVKYLSENVYLNHSLVILLFDK